MVALQRFRTLKSLGTTEQTPLWYVITLGTPGAHQPGYIIAMVADAMASNRRQAISNHHADLITVILCHKYHVTVIKQTIFQRGREVGHPLVSLLLTGSPSDNDNVVCDIRNLSIKTW